MSENELRAFRELWDGLMETYRRPAYSDTAILLEFQALSAYSLADVTRAALAHKGDPDAGMYAPTAAHITARITGTQATAARAAWNRVRDAVQVAGRYGSVQFDDPALHYALNAVGGLVEVCDVDEDERPHLERRFVEHYRDGAARGVTWDSHDVPALFVGEHDRANIAAGREGGSVVRMLKTGRVPVRWEDACALRPVAALAGRKNELQAPARDLQETA